MKRCRDETAGHTTPPLPALLMLLCCSSAVGCGNQPKERTLTLRVHALARCAPSLDDASNAQVDLSPLGDFPGDDARVTSVALLGTGPLSLPERTRAVAAVTETGSGRFIAYSERGEHEIVPLLLWPAQRACELGSSQLGLGSGGGEAIGYSPAARLVLVAGGDTPEAPAVSVAAATFDAGTGEYAPVVSDQSGDGDALSEPRAFATISAFGSGFLVAGGENPLRGATEALSPPSATADIFDATTRRFTQHVALNLERTRHSAVVLASGDTLLVGGRGPRGNALNVLEVVSVARRAASIAGLAPLEVPRLAPAVLALDDGRLFVGGGAASDGEPLSALEWFSSDAHDHLATALPSNLPRRHDRAFAAMPGGGVLAVGGCQISEVACGGDCRAGCPPTDLTGVDGDVRYDAWWIDAEGSVFPVELPIAAPRPVLLGGRDGAPLLATGASGDDTLYAFDPWRARFVATDLEVGTAPRAGDPAVGLDDQAYVWLSAAAEGRAFGLRWGTRDHFALDPLLVGARASSAEPAFPLVPDRPTADHVRYDASEKIVVFDGESAAALYVASADYANVTVDLLVEGAAPLVILGTREFGASDCPWPQSARNVFHLERTGERVVLSSGTDVMPPCAAPLGRLRLGLRAGEGGMVVRSLAVERRPE